MKSSKERRSRLIDELIDTAIEVMHHDIDIDDASGEYEIELLRQKFGAILDSAK